MGHWIEIAHIEELVFGRNHPDSKLASGSFLIAAHNVLDIELDLVSFDLVIDISPHKSCLLCLVFEVHEVADLPIIFDDHDSVGPCKSAFPLLLVLYRIVLVKRLRRQFSGRNSIVFVRMEVLVFLSELAVTSNQPKGQRTCFPLPQCISEFVYFECHLVDSQFVGYRPVQIDGGIGPQADDELLGVGLLSYELGLGPATFFVHLS